MGNRALITFERPSSDPKRGRIEAAAIYLHWNGGPESVWAFLDELTLRGRGNDLGYASARLVEIIGRYLGGNLSLGLVGLDDSERRAIERRAEAIEADLVRIEESISQGDNGVYVVGWQSRSLAEGGGRFAVIGHFISPRHEAASTGRWLTPEEITAEETEARASHYWHRHDKTGLPSIIVSIRAANAYSGAERAEVAA